MIFAPPLAYLTIIVLGISAVAQGLWLGERAVGGNVRPPVLALIVTIVLENAYYGGGRLVPEFYDDISWWWPGVMAYKLAYIGALASINLRLLKRW